MFYYERDWLSYNEALIRRGELNINFSVIEELNSQLKKANDGKVGGRTVELF
ncbi:MAG: hypothetical protein QXX17_08290 [Conexivisphaerales archaeon]